MVVLYFISLDRFWALSIYNLCNHSKQPSFFITFLIEIFSTPLEISTVAFGILFLPHLRCVFTRIICGVHQEWSGTYIRIEPIWYKGHGFGARIYTENTLQSGTIVRYACSLGTHNMWRASYSLWTNVKLDANFKHFFVCVDYNAGVCVCSHAR